jgi:hypothetical protein
MIDNLSVFIPAYSQIKSLNHSVELLKKVYPDCDIHLCSDNGYDFTEFCQKYGIDYKHYTNRLGYPESDGRYGWTKEKSLEFLRRVKTACEYLKNDYVILFEEDVLVTRKINLNMNFDISGYVIGNKIDKPILNYIKNNNGNINVDEFGAGGGCLFDRNKYLESFNKSYHLLVKDFDNLISLSRQPGWPDFLICFVFMMGGYQLSHNCEIKEINNNIEVNASILHKYKKYYE